MTEETVLVEVASILNSLCYLTNENVSHPINVTLISATRGRKSDNTHTHLPFPPRFRRSSHSPCSGESTSGPAVTGRLCVGRRTASLLHSTYTNSACTHVEALQLPGKCGSFQVQKWIIQT